MDIVDVLGLRLTLGSVAVIRFLRGIGRCQVGIYCCGSKGRVEIPQEILVSVDINSDLRRNAAAIGGIAVLSPKSIDRSALREIPTVRIHTRKNDDIYLLNEGFHLSRRKILSSIADAGSSCVGITQIRRQVDQDLATAPFPGMDSACQVISVHR